MNCAVCWITLNDKITAKKRDGSIKLNALEQPYCLNCEAMYGKPEPKEKAEVIYELNGMKIRIGDTFKHRDCDSFLKITGISEDDDLVNDTEVYYRTHEGEDDWMVLAYLMEHYEKVVDEE